MDILFVEDDQSLCIAVAYHLKKQGYTVDACHDGASALEKLAQKSYDLLLLDRMLPGASGVAITEALRQRRDATPVLMLTAMDGIHDRVVGLDAGADDYLVKPFAMDELMARIRALSRRKAPWQPEHTVQVGEVMLDTDQCLLVHQGQRISLSRREAKLMEVLMRNPGQILPRGVLLDRVWQEAMVEEGNLDIYVHFLRKHLKALQSALSIVTVRGIGYQLKAG